MPIDAEVYAVINAMNDKINHLENQLVHLGELERRIGIGEHLDDSERISIEDMKLAIVSQTGGVAELARRVGLVESSLGNIAKWVGGALIGALLGMVITGNAGGGFINTVKSEVGAVTANGK